MNTGTFFQPLLLTVAAELRQVAVVQPGDRVMIALSLQCGVCCDCNCDARTRLSPPHHESNLLFAAAHISLVALGVPV